MFSADLRKLVPLLRGCRIRYRVRGQREAATMPSTHLLADCKEFVRIVFDMHILQQHSNKFTNYHYQYTKSPPPVRARVRACVRV